MHDGDIPPRVGLLHCELATIEKAAFCKPGFATPKPSSPKRLLEAAPKGLKPLCSPGEGFAPCRFPPAKAAGSAEWLHFAPSSGKELLELGQDSGAGRAPQEMGQVAVGQAAKSRSPAPMHGSSVTGG